MAVTMALASGPAMAQSQHVAIPSYFSSAELWTKLASSAPGVGMTILNPNSGPGDSLSADLADRRAKMKAAGVKVLGYVHTSYGKRPIAEVQAEVDRYNQWYKPDGIFFDEVTNDAAGLAYYAQCQKIARAGHPKAIIFINPGTPVVEDYMKVADVVLTFESDYGAYVKRAPDEAWVAKYPARRFMHLVYGAPDIAALTQCARLSKQRHAGWVYFTPDDLPNPWDTVPADAYWSAELKGLAAK